MKKVIILITLVFTQISMAQSNESVHLWPNEVPNEKELKQEHELSDDDRNKVIRYSKVTDPDFLVFEPIKANKLRAAVIVCPGGAYNVLSTNLEGSEVAQWLNSLGFTAFVLNYRVPQKQLGALNDIQRAIRMIRKDAEKYNIEPDKIGVLGFSAGGSLVARASTQFTFESYSKIDEVDNLSCRPDFSMLVYPAYLDHGENNSLTPEIKVTKDTPPFFIFGSATDVKYRHSCTVMAAALYENNVPVDVHIIQEGGHGFGLRPGNLAAKMWPQLAEKWLERVLDKI
ncbi:alpha/beta hydrolase [Seonamhaeicola maritimus]|uniref:Alpha/beta hydrolase n=1 Tax=Seonamhaeicola maritimus TaxID=2591822 RepID=A0A5C7GLW9_9FLAO|nr:alpha/beta hydrolase [Seonamhaeicola maritimus]TXG39265.1 alpha/beta hydrolase [Seonamhaeicola maritimus]